MHRRRSSPAIFSSLFACLAALCLASLSGCGIGSAATGSDSLDAGNAAMGGILHGGANPIVGATITLYVTTSNGYGATATVCGSCTTTTGPGGFFNFTLPATGTICPAGQYAYVGAYSGTTGASTNNTNALLMTPIGACSANYGANNTYIGPSLWIDELTTAVSAYALGNFMTVTNGGAINIGAPANNVGTASASTPSAAGLAHAFANALALINISTGQPNAYMDPATSGGVIPGAEISLLGNILQACVNSTGYTTVPTATSNDGTTCGRLFSFTAAPSGVTLAGPVTAVPHNTLQAMLNLAKFPNPGGNVSASTDLQTATWNSACTGTGTSNTASTCLFNLAPTQAAYPGALSSQPPDWALAVVYTSGYGQNTTSTTPACTASPYCPGLTYPFYVALDYQDNVYVLNYDALGTGTAPPPDGAKTWTNIIGITSLGAPIFATPEDTTHPYISVIGTDTAAHVFGANSALVSTTPDVLLVYSASTGAVLASPAYTNSYAVAVAADPFNNIYAASFYSGINLRMFTYGGTSSAPTYAVSTVTSTGPAEPVYQLALDPNLDIYEFVDGNENGAATTNSVYVVYNKNTSTSTVGSYAAGSAPSTSVTLTGSTATAAGIVATSSNGAYAIDSVGITPITKGGTTASPTFTAGSATTIPAVSSSGLFSRYLSVDGRNWAYSADGANGGLSGVSVYDSVDNLALGTYKGCYVISGACGTAAGSAPIVSPRSTAIDSSGDVWVVSGAGANLAELIGAAAPTWPGLSMAKFGMPQ